MGTIIVVCICVVVTSFISGVFGMAGGIILMGIFGVLLPVRDAFVAHGASQLFSNSSRAWFMRADIIWSVVGYYMIGWALALFGFYLLSYYPNKGIVFIALGLVPWIGFALPKRVQPDIRKPVVAAVCGVVVTSFQLLAGASGPLLDYFYLTTNMTRHQIVGTKAFTQAVGHLAKLFYYGVVASSLVAEELSFSPWWLLALAPLAWMGTRLGKVVLDRMNDHNFRNFARWLTRGLGVLLAVKGIQVLVAG